MIEGDLGKVEGDLDHGDKLLNHMKRPMLHLFSSDNRSKPSAHHTDHKGGHSGVHPTSDGGPSVETTTGAQPHQQQDTSAMSDLERLVLALGELEEQAIAMNAEAVKSTEQIARVEQRLTAVNDRVQVQTKKATATMKAGNLF